MHLFTPTTVAGAKRLAASVCASVVLSVCLHDNSKTNDPKMLKFDIGMTSWYVWGQKANGQGHRVTNCKKNNQVGRVGFNIPPNTL